MSKGFSAGALGKMLGNKFQIGKKKLKMMDQPLLTCTYSYATNSLGRHIIIAFKFPVLHEIAMAVKFVIYISNSW